MSIDFNGTTSKLENTTADIGITGPISIVVYAFAETAGESKAGTILALDEARDSVSLQSRNALGRLEFKAIFDGADGEWSFVCPLGQWTEIAVSYDPSDVANNPVVFVNGVAALVTEHVTPTGTFTPPNTGYCVGNRTNGAQTWDGQLRHLQVFDEALSVEDMAAAGAIPGSVTAGLQLWLKMPNATSLTDSSGNGLDGTGTDLTTSTNEPPLIIDQSLAFTGSRRVVVHRTNSDTSVGETMAIFVDKSTLVGPDGTEPARLAIERIQWNVFGEGTITLSFDHTTDDIVAVLSGAGDTVYPDGGVVDPASAGGTGDLLLSTSAVVGGTYDITVTLRLKD